MRFTAALLVAVEKQLQSLRGGVAYEKPGGIKRAEPWEVRGKEGGRQ